MANPFLGQIQPFGFNFAPRGWLACNGQLLPISQYQALFSLLGTTYGGDGRTTFALPDLRGRASFQFGTGPGLPAYTWGQRGGATEVTLNAQQIPSHGHTAALNGTTTGADATNPTNAALANAREDTYKGGATLNAVLANGSVAVQNAGGGGPHNNMQPYLAINFCIAAAGIFPSRN
jgi:microcystin-dependent protein